MFAHDQTRACAGGGLRCRFVAISSSLLLAACSHAAATPELSDAMAVDSYGALPDERFPIMAVRQNQLKPEFRRQLVAYETAYPAGTIVVDPNGHYLYLVMPGGQAMRYGIGVGREGFAWSGTATIARKAEWPKWTPPAEMIARDPQLEPYRHGMASGMENPLGARALYLFQNGKDTLYRLHGTSDARSIGRNVSSGCIRLLNQDVIDLYQRTPTGSQVVVLGSSHPAS